MNDSSERSEKPTPQKLREAKQKGIVLRSPELNSLISIATTWLALSLLVPVTAIQFLHISRAWIAATHDYANPGVILSPTYPLGMACIKLIAEIFAIVLILSITSASIYGGISPSLATLKPDFKRLNPINGIKKLLSKNTLIEIIKNSLKFTAIAILAISEIDNIISMSLKTSFDTIGSLSETLLGTAIRAVSWLFVIQLTFSIFDMWNSRRKFHDQLKMSHHEIKEEYKRQEGSPEIRKKRKQQQSALMQQLKALANVKNSDVIVTNPTHVAVALKYEPERFNAPKVIASGSGLIASLIRLTARRNTRSP